MYRTVFTATSILLAVLTMLAQAAYGQAAVLEEDFSGITLGTRISDPSVGWDVDFAFPGTRSSITPVDSSRSPIWNVQDAVFIQNQPDGGDLPTAPFVDPYPLVSYSMVTDFNQVENYSLAAITPALDLSSTASAHLRYDLFSDGFQPAPNDYFEVWLSDDNGATWQGPFNQILAQQSVTPATHADQELDLTVVSGSSNVRIAFVCHGDDIYAITGWAFDNVEVTVPVMVLQNEDTSDEVADGGVDDLGTVIPFVEHTTEYRITAGGIDIDIDSITVTGSSNISGSASIDGPAATAVDAGDFTTFEVTYTPQSGTFSIEFAIEVDQAPSTFTFSLTGDGTDAPDIELEVQGNTISHNGEANLGALTLNGTQLTVTIRNAGSEPLTLTGSSPASASGVTNATVSIANQPSSTSLAASETTTFAVSVAPQEIGAFEATVSVASNDPEHATYTIHLRGNGTVPISSGGSSGCGIPGQPGHGSVAATMLLLALLLLVGATLRRQQYIRANDSTHDHL